MRVECKIEPGLQEPSAVIHVARMTPAVGEAVAILEREGDTVSFAAVRDGRTYFVEPETLVIVRTEGRDVVCYDKLKNRYVLNKPLYELEELLGRSFVRISKSAIVNIRQINHVGAGFNGTMEIVMKNGIADYISRSFRKSFKERLGL